MKRTICIFLLALSFCIELLADGSRLTTVVIDAGHGGKDAGCVSADNKTYEKTITLDIAKTLSDKIKKAYPDVKVILTRSKDEYITLENRAAQANKADADLFISIHINATERNSPNGYSVHILGQSSNKNRDLFAYNMDVCRRENSVVMLEDDYSTKYQDFDPTDPESYIFMVLMQNSHLEQSFRFAQIIQQNLKGGPIKADRGIWQDPFFVLWKTAMPSVLVELGFMSNPNDLSILRQKSKRDELAQRLFLAFADYKTIYDESLKNTSVEEEQATQPAQATQAAQSAQPAQPEQEAADVEPEVKFGIQVLASGRVIDADSSLFLGYEAVRIKSGKLYKYFLAVTDSLEETKKKLSEIKKTYPDAFLVRLEGDNVTRIQ